jgi:hypothetical protein
MIEILSKYSLLILAIAVLVLGAVKPWKEN